MADGGPKPTDGVASPSLTPLNDQVNGQNALTASSTQPSSA